MERKTKRCVSRILALALVFALCLSMLGAAPGSSASSSGASDIFISEYVEGSGSNKAIEIYNGTGAAVNLSDYTLVMVNFSGSSTPTKDATEKILNLSGTLQDGDTFVYYNSGIGSDLANAKNKQSDNTVINFNGNDYVYLKHGDNIIDVIGGTSTSVDEYPFDGAFASDVTLVRNADVTGPSATYVPGQWTDKGKDYLDGLGTHTMNGDGGVTPDTVAAPQADPQAGAVVSGTQVTLSCTTDGATIYYTLNGDEPTTSSTQYTGPISLAAYEVGSEVTLKAIAVKDGVTSEVHTIRYNIRAESEPPIANGDKVVIYNPEYKKALSSEKVNPTSFYNKGVDVELINGVLTGYTTTEVWTVVDNKDGTFSFQYGEQNIGLADQYNSMNLGAVNDRWKLIDLGNGLYNIQNAGRGNYMEWYNSENNWSTYNSNSAATDGQFQLAFYKVTGDIPDPSEPEVPIKAGDKVGIYLPSEQLVITTTANSYGEHLVGATATLENNELTTEADNAEFTVSGNNTEGFTFVSADGKYLTTSDSGNTLTMADASSDYSLWILESNGSGGWFIKNKNAAYNDNAQYIEYFNSNFTTYSKYSNSDTAIYSFQFYPIAGEGSEDGMPIKADDTVGIYLPDSSIVITATASGNRLSGASATLDEGTLTTEATDAVFTVGGNSTEGFTFESADGKYLTTSATGNTLSMEDSAGEYSRWILEQNGEDGWFIKSMNAAYNGNAQYIEYYGSSFKTYSKYSDSDTDIYTFQFYPVTVSEDEPGEELPSGLVVLASPVSGAVVSAGDTITLTTMEDATIYYTVNGDDPTTSSTKYTEPLTIGGGSGQVPAPTSGEPIVIKDIASPPADGTVEDSVDQTSSVYTFTYRAPDALDGYNLYFGQLHSHTNISDGAGSVTEAFQHASRVENLDFLAVTDHSNSFGNQTSDNTEVQYAQIDLGKDMSSLSAEWAEGHSAAAAVTDEDFVGIYGFEMTWSDGFGHINTFNTLGYESRNDPDYANNPTGHINYYNKLVEVESSLSQFNHPGTTFGDFADFGYYSQAYDERINLIEVGNGEGAIGSSGYFPSYEYYTRALDKGWHVAPTNNQDNHKGNWGDSNTARSVVLASELTEDAIYDAIANHRVYATEDNDLSILYSLNDNVMGSIIGEQDAIEIEAQISDPTDSADMTVEVIVNGGLVIGSKTLSGGKGTVTFNFDSNDYSYYYLRVTQADKNIAVTAPVWTGESINAGISKTECDTVLVVKDETVNISSELFNNSNLDMQVNSLVYTVDGETIYTADVNAIGNSGVISTGGTAIVTFPHAFTAGGATSVEATMTATIGDTAYTFTSVLQLTVTDESLVTRVLVDGTHWNDYVNGYYSGNMTNLIEIGGSMNAQVTIQQPGDPITADDLKDVALLVISAPLKYTSEYTGEAVVSTFEDRFIEVVCDYVNDGGTVIVCGLADYQDANAGLPYTTYAQVNKLLEGIGSSMRVNDDELIDQNENGGQPYRLYFDDFNFGSTDPAVQAALAGLQGSDKVYSSYSGCSVSVGNGAAIVYGHDTTYSINSKAPAQGHDKPVLSYEDAYNEDTAVVKKGDVVSLATEAVGNGRVYVGGTVWVSNFEVTSDGSNGNDYGDASYANKTIITNILSGLLVDPEISTIAEARAGNDGDIFTVKGTVIAGSVSPNAFFDCIYIQDGTGAICLHPVNDTVGTFRVGQTVVATGYRGDYQGDVQLGQVISAEVVDSTVSPISPAEYTLAEASDYDNNGGYLAKVSGTVKSVTTSSGQISTVILTDGTNDFRLLFNNYIGYSNSASPDITTFVKEGAEISAVGVIYMDPQGACLRVRDLSEVVLVSAEEPDDPDEPIWPVYPGDPVRPGKPDEDDDDMPELTEPFIDVNENDWFYDAVVYVYNEGMMSGIEADVFSPDGSMTRAMFWTVLARIDGADTSGGLEWYSAAQKWAISEGVSDGTEPNALITREQLATMLWRYAGEPEGNSTLDGFTDSGSVSYWAYDALVWAVENGIVTGMGDGILAPQGTATRAQAATMFMRYMSVVK